MIRVHRVYQIKEGQGQAANQWAKDVVKYFKEHYPQDPVPQFFADHSKPLTGLHFMMDQESLASWEALVTRVSADPGFVEVWGGQTRVAENNVTQAYLPLIE